MTGVKEENFDALYLITTDNAYIKATLLKVIEAQDGYSYYLFKSSKTSKTIKSLRIDPIGTLAGEGNLILQVSDVVIGDQEKMIEQGFLKSFATLRLESPNTIIFSDILEGLDQFSPSSGISKEYTTAKKWADESGSVKITATGNTHNWINLETAGFTFNDGDYVVVRIYNDTTTEVLSLLWNYGNGVILEKGQKLP